MIENYAHVGYVYALTIARLDDSPVLVSGSGDEDIKVPPASSTSACR
jgi:hypothetical protein